MPVYKIEDLLHWSDMEKTLWHTAYKKTLGKVI